MGLYYFAWAFSSCIGYKGFKLKKNKKLALLFSVQ